MRIVKQRHFTEVLKCEIWNSHSDSAAHSSLLQCDTVLLGEQFPTTHPTTLKEILITRSTYTYTIIFLHKFSQHFIQFTFLFIFWGHWEVLHFIHHLLALGNIRRIHLWKAWWQIYRCQGAGCSWDHSWSQILGRRVILQIKWHWQNTRALLMCWWGLQTCNWSYRGGTSGAKNLVIVAEKILSINSLVLKLNARCDVQQTGI